MTRKVIYNVDDLSEMKRLNKEGYLILCHRCYSEVIFNDSEIKCSKNPDHIYTTVNKTRYLKQKYDLIRMKEGIKNMEEKGCSKKEIINYVEKYHAQYLEYFNCENLKVDFDFENFNIRTGKFDKNERESNIIRQTKS